MNKYNFTFTLSGFDELTMSVEDALFEAGCDDALLGIQGATPILEFDRQADSFEAALLSAIEDVEQAGFKVIAVEPDDLVSVTDIAERVGRSRQNVAQLVAGERGPGTFPSPVHGTGGKRRLWRWGDVLEWIAAQNGPPPHPDAPTLEQTQTTAAINSMLTLRRYRGDDGSLELLSRFKKGA